MPEPLRVESLRELDALVAERVMGDPRPSEPPPPEATLHAATNPFAKDVKSPGGCWIGVCLYEEGDVARWEPRPYSLSIAAAWEVDEQARAEGRIARTVVVVTEAGENFVTLYPGCKDGRFYVSGGQPTLPLALCVAHLRAVGVEVELSLPEAEERQRKERG